MVKSETVTILFVDIVNYTKRTSELNREELSLLHDLFDSLCLPIFSIYEGTIIKKIGDAFLVTFRSKTNALLCSIRLQKSFKEFSSKFKKFPIEIRVAIHSGEVLLRGNDIYGTNVNIASRIEGITKPGDILFSETLVFGVGKQEVLYKDIGIHKLKGVKTPIRLFKVIQEKKPISYVKIALIIIIAIAAIFVLIVIYSAITILMQ